MITRLLRFEPSGPNCASATLLGRGALRIPIFIPPSLLQSWLEDPRCAQLTNAMPGAIGAIYEEHGEYIHYFLLVTKGQVFTRYGWLSKFQFDSIENSQKFYSESRGTHYYKWAPKRDCPLVVWQDEVEGKSASLLVATQVLGSRLKTKGAPGTPTDLSGALENSFWSSHDQLDFLTLEAADDVAKRTLVIDIAQILSGLLKDSITHSIPSHWQKNAIENLLALFQKRTGFQMESPGEIWLRSKPYDVCPFDDYKQFENCRDDLITNPLSNLFAEYFASTAAQEILIEKTSPKWTHGSLAASYLIKTDHGLLRIYVP
ncbi:MAG: hypothetical protein ACXVA9_03120 [Bdellovibrionales bacterium]